MNWLCKFRHRWKYEKVDLRLCTRCGRHEIFGWHSKPKGSMYSVYSWDQINYPVDVATGRDAFGIKGGWGNLPENKPERHDPTP